MQETFEYFTNLRREVLEDAGTTVSLALKRFLFNKRVKAREEERLEKIRMKEIANKAKSLAMRRKFQTSNYTSLGISGDSSIPINTISTKVEALDPSLKLSKNSSGTPQMKKKNSSSALGMSAKNNSVPIKLQKYDTNMS